MDFMETIESFDFAEDLLPELWNDESLKQVKDSMFWKRAKQLNLIDNIQTLFIPGDDVVSSIESDEHFISLFNRHASKSLINICGPQNLLHTRMISSICYAIYFEEEKFYIGGVQIISYNNTIDSVCVHLIGELLPNLKITNLESLPLVLVSNTSMKIEFEPVFLSVDTTLHISFVTFESRQNIGGSFKKHIEKEKNNSFEVVVETPKVQTLSKITMWVQIFSTTLGIPLISWLRPHNTLIYPNPMMHKDPIVYEFAPLNGIPNNPLFIHGKNFSKETTRVMIGQKSAIVYYASDTFLKCILPTPLQNENKVNIQVANGNIFTTTTQQFTYINA